MIMAILLSLLAVSLELDYWKFWGAENSPAMKARDFAAQFINAKKTSSGVAMAAPVPTNSETSEDEGESDTETPMEESNDTSEDEGESDTETPIEESNDTSEDEGESDADTPQEESNDTTGDAESKEESTEKTEDWVEDDKEEVDKEFESNEGEEADEESSNNSDSSAESTKTGASDGSPASEQSFKSVRKSRAKTFMVVFMGHSGSTAYTTELRTHSEFEVELLEPLEHGDYQGNTDLALQKASELMERGIANGKIPGFKIRPFHIQNKPDAWRKFVQKYDTRIIWQYRVNILKQAIGEYRHRFLNDSSVVEGLRKTQKPCEGKDQKCRITIKNMRGLHGLMNDLSKSDELLTTAARILRRPEDMLVVRYEDYLYRRERTMRETFDFFGVDFQDTAPQRLKASPDSLCEMVINFQDVCDHFYPCQLWRPYLHDDVNDCRCKPGAVGSFDSTYCKREAWYQS